MMLMLTMQSGKEVFLNMEEEKGRQFLSYFHSLRLGDNDPMISIQQDTGMFYINLSHVSMIQAPTR